MFLTTAELVYISEAAKALKQKDFILIDNAMIGIDNIDNILTYTLLDTNFINNYFSGVIINARALSAFIKSISVESSFEFSMSDNIIKTMAGVELPILFNNYIAKIACDKFRYASTLEESHHISVPEVQISDIMGRIQSMSKKDGGLIINYNNYLMTLFPSILPVNKSDKMFITIMEEYSSSNTFISKFRISKKKFDIITYIYYLKI